MENEPLCPNREIVFHVINACTNAPLSSQKWTATNGVVTHNPLIGLVTVFIRTDNNSEKLTVSVEWVCQGQQTQKLSRTFRVKSIVNEVPTIASNSVHGANPQLGYCENASITLNRMKINAASDANNEVFADAYRWILPAGFSINGQTGVVDTNAPTANIVTNGCNTGIVKVFGVSICDNIHNRSKELAINIQRKPVDNLNLVFPASASCGKSFTVTLQDANVSCAGTIFQWSILDNPDWVINSGQGSTNVGITPAGSGSTGTVQVTATLPCGTVLTGKANITLDKSIATPQLQAPNTVLCAGSPATFRVETASSGIASYRWETTQGVLINGTTSPVVIPSSFSYNEVTLTAPASVSGSFITVTITITNICGTSNSISRSVWVGKPSDLLGRVFVMPDRASGSETDLYVCPNKEYNFRLFPDPFATMQGITHYEWYFTCGTALQTLNNGRDLRVKTAMAYNPCEEVWVRGINSCGTSEWQKINVDFSDMCGERFLTFRVFSNPSRYETQIQIENLPQIDYTQNTEQAPAGFAYQIRIFDKNGALQKIIYSDRVTQKINIADLPEGNYQVNVQTGSSSETRTLIIKR